MPKLTRQDLFSLEQYAATRHEFRAQVMAHKQDRRVAIGNYAALYFEDALTVQYQVQEMLRIERIFEAQGIQDELDVYNPLIPDGTNWKATFMLEYPHAEDRRLALTRLVGIEHHVHIQVQGFCPVYAICNEDLDRSTEDKTSAVHFMRFELTPDVINAIHNGVTVTAGINYPTYSAVTTLTDATIASLRQDLLPAGAR